jgi:branched-chain amino acid transport system permease protein
VSPRLRLLALAALAVVAVCVPFMFGSFRVGQFTQVLAYAVAILGLNLLVGYSGQISLGHGAFFALGAYVAAILIADHGFPHLLTVPIAGRIRVGRRAARRPPALRVRGLYLALLTLGPRRSPTPPVIKRLDSLTGGAQGMNVASPEPPSGVGLAQDQWIYFVTLAVAVVLFALVASMLRGRVGRALITIRDDELVARSMGVNLALYKTRAFAISAAYAGMGGALYVFTVGFVSPESFTVTLSIGLPGGGGRRGPGDVSARCWGRSSSSSCRSTPRTWTRRWPGSSTARSSSCSCTWSVGAGGDRRRLGAGSAW